MRKARILGEGDSLYHTYDRCIGFILDDEMKEIYCALLEKYVTFCGLTCKRVKAQDNHTHDVIGVPDKAIADAEITDAELVERYRVMYPKPTKSNPMPADRLAQILAAGGELAQKQREKLLRRMHDLSNFKKEFKAAVTRAYNARHDHRGTIWLGRYGSTVLENDSNLLRHVYLYVDLNGVRSGKEMDPAEDRHGSYAADVRGDDPDLKVLRELMERCQVRTERPLAQYQIWMAEESVRPIAGKHRLTREQAKEVFHLDQLPDVPEYCDVLPYFQRGGACGSDAFVKRTKAYNADRVKYSKRHKVQPAGDPRCPGMTVLRMPRDIPALPPYKPPPDRSAPA